MKFFNGRISLKFIIYLFSLLLLLFFFRFFAKSYKFFCSYSSVSARDINSLFFGIAYVKVPHTIVDMQLFIKYRTFLNFIGWKHYKMVAEIYFPLWKMTWQEISIELQTNYHYCGVVKMENAISFFYFEGNLSKKMQHLWQKSLIFLYFIYAGGWDLWNV